MDDAIGKKKTATVDVTKILLPEQMQWLKAQVAAGQYPSIEEGIRAAVDLAQHLDDDIQDEDLDWAKPYIEEALAEMKAGKGIPADEVFARLKERFK
jgi:Arc/MetJ-type ribon-helix-helix transcriptional regulator